MKYIATFYSHFGAVRFKKICEQYKYSAKLMPVPRDLSSSCGTCVSFESDSLKMDDVLSEELEQIACISSDGYEVLFRAADS